MVESLKAARGLMTTIVLIGYAAAVVFALIGSIADGATDQQSFGLGLGSNYGHFTVPTLAIALTVFLVTEVVVQPTPAMANLHAIGSVVLNAVSVLLTVVFGLVYLVAWGLSIAHNTGLVVIGLLMMFASLTVNVVCGLIGLKVMSGLGHQTAPAAGWPQGGYAGQPGLPGPATQPAPPQGPAPVWQPEQAAGMSWGSAQEAATGNAGQQGGGPGGWQPQPVQQPVQQPQGQAYGQPYPQQPGFPPSAAPAPQPYPQQPGAPASQPSAQGYGQQPSQQPVPQPSANPAAQGYPAQPAPQPSANPMPASAASAGPAGDGWDDDRTEIARRPDLPQ